LISSP